MIGHTLRRIVAATSCAGLLTAGLLVGAGPATADAATGPTDVGYPITWANYTVNAVAGDGTPLRVKLAEAMGSDGHAYTAGAKFQVSMVLAPGTDGIHDPVASSIYTGQTSTDTDCPDDESYWYTDGRSQRVTRDCWENGMNPNTGSGPFGVIVPLVAHKGEGLVVFDHWATAHVTAGCDTGFTGARDPYFEPDPSLLAGTLYGLDDPPTYGAPDDSSWGPADRYESPGRGATFLSWYDAAGPSTASQSQDGQRFTATAVYAPASPDTSKPIPSIETPMDCANYVRGQTYPASYDCVDPGQSVPMPASQCVGTVADGAAFDTDTLGKHTFTVTGTDAAGNSRSRTVTYNVVPPNSSTAQTQEISWQSSEPQDATYGGSYTPEATAPGGAVTFSVDSRTADVCTLDQDTLEFTGVGSCVLYGNQAGGTDYKAAPQAVQTIQVGPAPVTITADDQSIPYGSAQPTYTYSASGLVPGDDLTTEPTCGTTRTPGSVGSYAIVCSGANDPNYTFSYDPGTLTVSPAPVTITAKSVSITYGDKDPTAYGYTISGLVGGDTLTTDPTCEVADPHSDAGSYAITCTGATAGPDYTVGYAPGTLEVAPAPVAVTAENATKVYGTPDPDSFSATVTGLLGDDTLSTQPQCGVAGVHVDAGTYPITCSGADAGDNYAIAYLDGTFTITKAALTFTGAHVTRAYGETNPPLTASPSGFVSGDTAATAYSGAPDVSTSADRTSDVGSYAIEVSTGSLTSKNYTFAFVPGTLTVTQASTTLTGGALITANQGDAASVDFSHVQAMLMNVSAGTPAAGKRITFTVAGQRLCTAVTDATGTATCEISHDQMTRIVRNGGYLATFGGTDDLAGATGYGDVVRHDRTRR